MEEEPCLQEICEGLKTIILSKIMYKYYQQEELEQIVAGLNSGTSISELSIKLDRTPYGIANKLMRIPKNSQYYESLSEEARREIRRELRKHRGSKGDVRGQKKRWKER